VDLDVREHGNSRYTVHISLDKSEVNNAFGNTYQQLSERGGIKGFRPGKAPRKILDRHYENDIIRAITYDDLVQRQLEKAMEQADLRPIDQLDVNHGAPPDEDAQLADTIKAGLVEDDEEGPGAEEATEAEAPEAAEEAADEADEADEAADESAEEAEETLEDAMEDVPLREGEPFEFYATFTAYPKPELPNLSGLKLKRPVAEVAQERIDEQLEELRRVNAEEVETDRDEIADGDLVVVQIGIILEDEDPDDVELRQEEIVVGERDYIGDIDQAVVGHKAGETVEVEYTFDEDHPNEELAGKNARVKAEIESFSARKLPEVDDEFAQSLGDYETLDDLCGSIREQLEAAEQSRAQEELRGQVLRQMLEGTQVELPEQMIEDAAGRSFEELRDELKQTGMTVEEFAEANDLDVDELRENQRSRAETTLKLHFAVEALASEHEIEADEADMMAEMQRIAAQGGGDLEFVLQAAAVQPNFMGDVRERVVRRKLLDELIAEADVEDMTAEEYEAWVETQEAEEAAAEADAASDEEPVEVDKADAGEASKQARERGVEPSADEDVEESDDE